MRASEKKDDQDRDGHSARFEAQSDSASEDGVSIALEGVRSAAHALHGGHIGFFSGAAPGSGANLGLGPSRSCLPRRSGVVCLRNQGGPPDFRHCCRGSAKLADLELPFLDLFRQLDAADDDRCRSETLQSQHRAESLLHPTVVLFDGVVQYLLLRTRTRFGNSPVFFRSATARWEAA